VAVASADGGLQVRGEAPALEILGLPAITLGLTKAGDPAQVGGKVAYKITVTNTGTLPGSQVVITATVPPQMQVVHTDGPTKARIDGQKVIFAPVDGPAPRQTLTYSVEVQAVREGDVRFQVELTANTLVAPVIKQESTNILAPVNGAQRAPASPLGTPVSGQPEPPAKLPPVD
jgi:uncharacterized repeat protein (TIGR01451 family)